MDNVELSTANGKALCYVIRQEKPTPADNLYHLPGAKQQVGFVVYPMVALLPGMFISLLKAIYCGCPSFW
jgi:hypothetical protein